FVTSMATDGKARFANVPKSDMTAQVVAPGFETAKKGLKVLDKGEVKVKIDLQPMSDREAAASDKGISALNPKAQRDLGKALESLRANKPSDARNYLDAAQRDAPNSAEVEYLYGVYASQMGDPAKANAHWMKALEINPKHLSSLLAVSQGYLQNRKAAEAVPYLTQALEVEPSSWRAHMLMAQADLFQGKHEDAVKEAERAMELGHERAASVEPLLAHALYENGDKERAIKILQDYVTANPKDINSAKLLERFKNPPPTKSSESTVSAIDSTEETTAATALAIPSNWLPPDVDEKIPAVEPGASCSVDEVVQKASKQIVQFVHDVDRFAATESLVHESVNKYGVASSPEKRKFDYLVSIQDIKQGYLGVTEYRNGGGAQNEFPDGIVTNGLPALVLIFHPYYAPNYEMTCEGLSRANGGLAWQVHFRQIPGKPNELKTYQIGVHGPTYSVGLKGRAWISADTFQIIRMETDIVAPVPQIKLLAEHTLIEYGPVNFKQDNENLWLPQSAEVYFAWRGRQVHRRHSFSNYMLFGVNEQQRIATPKDADPAPETTPAEQSKP
ncbi:MAG TPA: tetratricopeptide repeat protein, partial [Candidatus Acidoferrum sp.]|nr:tetratricopeptide repeat protein [Candidatus Acidoferrum sp.]